MLADPPPAVPSAHLSAAPPPPPPQVVSAPSALLSHITVQHDFATDLLAVHTQDVPSSSDTSSSQSFWLSTYNFNGKESVHSNVSVTKTIHDEIKLTCDDIPLEFVDLKTFKLKNNQDQSYINIKAPIQSYTVEIKKANKCIDVSPDGNLHVVSGYYNEKLYLINPNNGTILTQFEGHIGPINTCKFFPSGKVILSGGSDLKLKIWGLDGGNPVTLKGHQGAILDSAIVGRGKNVLSCARDGMIKLWECGSGINIHTFNSENGSVNGMSLGQVSFNSDGKPGDREYETEGKQIYVATEKGSMMGFDIRSKNKIMEQSFTNKNEPLLCCHFQPKLNLLAYGSTEGKIEIYDTRNMKIPIAPIIQRNKANILNLYLLENKNYGCLIDSNIDTDPIVAQLIFSTADGSISRIQTTQQNMKIIDEYIGFDIEPIYGMKIIENYSNENSIVCCGRDGIVKKWEF